MNDIVQFVVKHGYSILFASVFARQTGMPVPANCFVVAVRGARSCREVGRWQRRGGCECLCYG